ncbi:hypothetical protein JCM16496A_31390 [Bacteroides rodentium JCM 16496]
MKRIRTKIGDVFCVKLSDKEKRYFQLVAYDLTQLNSDVIRVFKRVYDVDANPPLSEIIKDDVDFYAHCVTKFGPKLSLWDKVGYISDVGDTRHILFRDTSDMTERPEDKPVEISHNWYVWHINDEKFTYVGKLKGANRKADIGLVMSPYEIVHRLKTGRYMIPLPGF